MGVYLATIGPERVVLPAHKEEPPSYIPGLIAGIIYFLSLLGLAGNFAMSRNLSFSMDGCLVATICYFGFQGFRSGFFRELYSLGR